MIFAYHFVPEKMRGKILYPLNQLKKKYPISYRYELEKYSWRKYILKKKIPLLNCLWNDVLHFTLVHPKKIKKALKEQGFNPQTFKVYKIPLKNLNKSQTIIYLNNPRKSLKAEKKDYKKIDSVNLSK